MRWWAPAVVPLALLASGLAGCSGERPPDLQTTALDVERASAVWVDPWAAPDATTLPGADAPGTNPVRLAGTRTTAYPAGTEALAAALAEVTRATSYDWSLLGADCAGDEVVLALGRGSGADDGMRAEVTVGSGASGTVAEVAVEVAHHADGAWPDVPGTDPLDTCLAGSTGGELPAAPEPDAHDPGGGEPGPGETVEWQDSEASETDVALRDALEADPWYAGLGAQVDEGSRIEPGVEDRLGPTALAEVTTTAEQPAPAVTEVVDQMAGWEITWAACGARGPAAVSARLVTEDGVVTARLTSAGAGTVTVEVRLPAPEAPTFDALTDPPALDAVGCLGGGEPGVGVVEGVPVAVPGPIPPYLG